MRRMMALPVAAVALAAVVAFAGVGRPESARGDSTQTDIVTTNGHGVITAVPDEATVSAGVRTDAATAAAALAENATSMNAVIAALKKAGGENVQTQQVSLYPSTDQQGKVTGYTAQNTVSAKAKIAGAGALVDAAVGAGANTVDGPSLSLSDQDALYRDALKKAVAGRAREGARARRRGRVRRRPRLDRRRAERHRAAGVQPGGARRREGCVDAHRAGDGRCDGRRHGVVHDPLAGNVARSAKGPFAARTDAAGGALPVGQVHRQRLVAGAPELCRACQRVGHSRAVLSFEAMCVPQNLCS